ncbi:hypothetical protein FNJ84_21230 [Paracoccus sp. M683]|uniref:hypothetical protein n=1 Tax=Paracoccus sp. M683 TaxID=2594268 RepID=UPI001180717B|nr:hypothetical protein [Paracoccus sp. M683]TRW92130.1 hypothetical protein FNJ84_21230 [Paracoccus sp. M683]
MQLTDEIFQSLRTGKFEDFLDTGADELTSRFRARFVGMGEIEAHDAARNVVGEAYEETQRLRRPSALLSMRVAYARLVLGAGVLSDPRFPGIAACCERQAAARRIEDDKSIGELLARMSPYWEHDHLADVRRIGDELLSRPLSDADGWTRALDLLATSHRKRGGTAGDAEMRAFINAAYADAWNLGLQDQALIVRHVLIAEALGLRFFVDPMHPGWMSTYDRADPRRIASALNAAFGPETHQREN